VLIADDDELVRRGIAKLLSRDSSELTDATPTVTVPFDFRRVDAP